MSGKWEGFTEQDIRNINTEGTHVKEKPSVRVAKLQPNSSRQQAKKNVNRGKMAHVKTESNDSSESSKLGFLVANSVCKTNTSLNSEESPKEIETNHEDLPLKVASVSQAGYPKTEASHSVASDESPNHIPVCIRIKEDRSYEVVGTKKTSLEDFQVRQKLMEEQNRHRKDLLGKALADRKKRTHAEAHRLSQIQEELQKLDTLLSNDVSILRNQIEVASLEFNEAQKRYNKAEKEFLDAKIIMFGKLEQKELLTEHLCTIIEQNEMRKARKLSELMDKLELGVMIEVPVENQTPPTICFVNDVSDSPYKSKTNELPVQEAALNSEKSQPADVSKEETNGKETDQ